MERILPHQYSRALQLGSQKAMDRFPGIFRPEDFLKYHRDSAARQDFRK